jgi:hypothetical protein
VVGKHEGWEWTRKDGSAKMAQKYGYLDYRPCYETRQGAGISIAVKVEIRKDHNDFVKVCSFPMAKEGLKHSTFRLDLYKDPPCSECDEQTKQEHIRRHLADELPAAAASAAGGSGANANTTDYVVPPLDTLMHLSDRKYHGDECHIVNKLPVGKHVLVITTNEVPNSHVHSLSHVITW